jgi:hypothetical protein
VEKSAAGGEVRRKRYDAEAGPKIIKCEADPMGSVIIADIIQKF